MAVSHQEQWQRLYRLLDGYDAYCPREVKAWAMALTVLGYSSRQIERELRHRFPGERVPNYATIARWQRSRPANALATWGWMDVASRALVILRDRMDEISIMPIDKLIKAALHVREIAYIARDGYRRHLPRYRA